MGVMLKFACITNFYLLICGWLQFPELWIGRTEHHGSKKTQKKIIHTIKIPTQYCHFDDAFQNVASQF